MSCLVLTEKMQYHLLPARNRMFAGKNSVGFSLLFNKACYRRQFATQIKEAPIKRAHPLGCPLFIVRCFHSDILLHLFPPSIGRSLSYLFPHMKRTYIAYKEKQYKNNSAFLIFYYPQINLARLFFLLQYYKFSEWQKPEIHIETPHNNI